MLHAGVAVNTRERKKLERICRYASRPALSEARLELTDQGMVRYALKTAYRDGTMHVVFEWGGLPPSDFMAKLAELGLHGRLFDIRHHKRVIFNYDTYLTLCLWEKSSIYSHKNGSFIWLKIY